MKTVLSKFNRGKVALSVGLAALVGVSAILSSKYDVQQVVGPETAPRTAHIKKTIPLKVRAEQGDIEAQLELGNRYFTGQDVNAGVKTHQWPE